MASRRPRRPLAELSNLPSLPPSNSPPSKTSPPSTTPPLLSSGCFEPCNQTATVITDPSLPRSTSEVMDVVPCVSTPLALKKQAALSCSSAGKSLVTYNRRKTGVLSHLTMSCPPQINRPKKRRTEDSDKVRQVTRRSAASMFDEPDRLQARAKRMRRMSLPNMPKWLPSEFVSSQRSHFADVDAFELSEEEGELSDND